MKLRDLGLLTLCMTLGGCFKAISLSKGSLENATGGGVTGLTEQAVSTSMGETKSVATFDPDSKSSTQLTAPTVKGLQGASVVIPSGSLGIATDIVVEQAADFGDTSMTAEMGLADDIQVSSSSPGMIIRPTQDVDLKKPLSLAMPLPAAFGMRLADTGSRYAIFYKYFDPAESKLLTGFKVVDGVNVILAFDEASGHDVLQFQGYFGAYWATTLSREVKPSEVPAPKPAEEPIINKAKVSVVETKGFVKETEIVVKQAAPELVWGKPLLTFKAASRSVVLAISVPAGHSVSGCKVDLFEASTLLSGISLETPLGTNVEYIVKKLSRHSLVGRFRCSDEEGRSTLTPWSDSVVVPIFIAPELPSAAPAVATLAPTGPGVCTATQAAMIAREYGSSDGQAQPLTALGGCKYSASLFLDGATNFLITFADSSLVCGLASHVVTTTSQILQCQPATAANLGSDFMSLAKGNYQALLDFSNSSSKPTLSLSQAPCDKGDYYVQFSDAYVGYGASPVFPAPSPEQKMTHLGGCEYVFETTTAPTQSYEGKMTITNLDGSVSCGNIDYGAYAYYYDAITDNRYNNTCSSAKRFFRLTPPTANVKSYRITLRLGAAASNHESASVKDSVRYERTTNCADSLYLLGTAFGEGPIKGINQAMRSDVCSYTFDFAADRSMTETAFRIMNPADGKLCGGLDSTASNNGSLLCGTTSLKINPLDLVAGRPYRLTIQGDALNGTLNAYSIDELNYYERNCDGGLYNSPTLSGGYFNSTSERYSEVKECIFEKLWTPTASNNGFYLHNGRNAARFCGLGKAPDGQPTIGGSARVSCRNDLNQVDELSAIKPLNALVGKTYRITVDMRLPRQAKVDIAEFEALALCSKSVSIIGMSSPMVDEVVMASTGDCNYTYDLTIPFGVGYGEPFFYHFKLDGQAAGVNTTNTDYPNLNGIGRTVALAFDYNNEFYLNPIQGQSYRFQVKRTSAGSTFTIQELTGEYLGTLLSGNLGLEVGSPYFDQKSLWGAYSQPYTYDWTVGPARSFLLKRNYYNYNYYNYLENDCALDPLSPQVSAGNAVDVICNIGSNYLANARAFESPGTAGQAQTIELTVPPTVEGRYKLKVYTPYNYASPTIKQIRGSNGYGGSADGDKTLTGDANSTPQALNGAATWTDSSGKLWMFGGSGRDELWNFDGVYWNLIDGVANGPGDQPTIPNVRPGARRSAATWTSGNNLYLFGGYGSYDDAGTLTSGLLSDLWVFNTVSLNWTFLKGSSNPNATSAVGTLGVAGVSNNPGGREGAVSWRVGNDLYLFGGRGLTTDNMNDLWKYSLTSGNWTWVSGNANSQLYAQNYPGPKAFAVSWYFADENALYMFGGESSSNGLGGQEFWQYKNGVWTLRDAKDNFPGSFSIYVKNRFSPSNQPNYYIWTQPQKTHAQGWVKGSQLWLLQDGVFWAYNRTLRQWAAMLMPGQDNEVPNFPVPLQPGAFNTEAPSNRLGYRQNSQVWASGSKVYLMGGLTYDSNGYSLGDRNDLWSISLPDF